MEQFKSWLKRRRPSSPIYSADAVSVVQANRLAYDKRDGLGLGLRITHADLK
jgi:hypothetical protein